MKERKIIAWIYARSDSADPVEASSAAEKLLKEAEVRNWTVAGVSQDLCTGISLERPGMREVMRAIHNGLANAVLIESLEQISGFKLECRLFLRFLQDHDAILIGVDADLRYELWITGLETTLIERAVRKHYGVPW